MWQFIYTLFFFLVSIYLLIMICDLFIDDYILVCWFHQKKNDRWTFLFNFIFAMDKNKIYYCKCVKFLKITISSRFAIFPTKINIFSGNKGEIWYRNFHEKHVLLNLCQREKFSLKTLMYKSIPTILVFLRVTVDRGLSSRKSELFSFGKNYYKYYNFLSSK